MYSISKITFSGTKKLKPFAKIPYTQLNGQAMFFFALFIIFTNSVLSPVKCPHFNRLIMLCVLPGLFAYSPLALLH